MCDAYIHNLIPPQLWKKCAKSRKAVAGQYLYTVKTHWQESNTVRNSVKEWVVDRVREVEEYVSTGYNAEEPDVLDTKV